MHRPDTAGSHATQAFERVCAFLSTSLTRSDTWSNLTQVQDTLSVHMCTLTKTRTDVCFEFSLCCVDLIFLTQKHFQPNVNSQGKINVKNL